MRVIKIGGGCLNGRKNIKGIVDQIATRGMGDVFVVSALFGITDYLLESMPMALAAESQIPSIIGKLKTRHLLVAKHLIPRKQGFNAYVRELEKYLGKLERLYYGLNFTRAVTPRLTDVISSYGERLSAQLLACTLRSQGLSATYRMPHKIGLVTDGKFGDATANLTKTARQFQKHLAPLLGKGKILFLPGFFGASEDGDITTFGRGGSDYSAAVIAAALDAERLEIWKDTEGFMSADPRLVPEARLIPVLSYEEAAELSYFGAKILHPRTVEPARRRKMKIAIKNTLAPDAPGSLIASRSTRPQRVIKSVAYDTDIAILKVHAAGVGARPGILGEVATCIAGRGINIKSVVTSQTCISLLLARRDLEAARQALQAIRPRPFRKLDGLADIALIGIVGDGLQHHEGIAARCFGAVAACKVNVEMISFGPSRAALYFLVKEKDLAKGVNAIHSTFFSSLRCRQPGVQG